MLGFAKAESIHEFTDFGIASFDSTSPLIRAFKDAKSNYYSEGSDGKLDYYSAIRIPQAIENSRLMQGIKRGAFDAENLRQRERKALAELRAFDQGASTVRATLDALMDYHQFLVRGDGMGAEQQDKALSKTAALVQRTLEHQPWKHCGCDVCRKDRRRCDHLSLEQPQQAPGIPQPRRLPPSSTQNLRGSRVTTYRFKAVRARQASGHDVFVFAAHPEDVLSFAAIERVARADDGQLKGFQRHQVASHIRDIRDYLSRDDALLPNAVIVAFIEGVQINDLADGVVQVEISAPAGEKPGFVVDGQQRLTALSAIDKPNSSGGIQTQG